MPRVSAMYLSMPSLPTVYQNRPGHEEYTVKLGSVHI